MKRGWIAAAAVAAVAAGIIVYKELGPKRAGASDPSAALSNRATPSVVAFVDPREENEAGGCGDIIRLVRDARARGVAVREVPPGSDRALERQYQVTVVPTVLVLGPDGAVTSRREGESQETVDAIHADLSKLTGRPK